MLARQLDPSVIIVDMSVEHEPGSILIHKRIKALESLVRPAVCHVAVTGCGGVRDENIESLELALAKLPEEPLNDWFELNKLFLKGIGYNRKG